MIPEHRIAYSTGRLQNYYDVMRTTIFVLAAVAIAEHLGPQASSAPLLMVVVATVAYGVLAGNTALDDIGNLIHDLDETTARSHFGKGLTRRNMKMLKLASAGVIVLTGLAEVAAILA